MLKGDSKGVFAENMREAKKKGLSERDAVLVSMKNSPKKDKKSKLSSPVCCDSSDAYPYGLRLDLHNDSLDKLDMDEMPKVGKTMRLVADVKVESVSEREERSSGEKNRNVSLQITKMKLS